MTIDRNPGASFLSASEYILDNFDPIDRIAMLVLNRDLGEVLQRVTTAKKASSPEFQAWLRYKNATGSDIYIGMNPLRKHTLNPNEGGHQINPARLPRSGSRRAGGTELC